MRKRRQTSCHPEPPKDTKCRRTVEGPPTSVPWFFVTALRGTATRPGTCAGGPSTVLRRRFLPGASAANLAAAPAAQDDSRAGASVDSGGAGDEMRKRRQTSCHPEPPKDTKCRRAVEGPPASVPWFFVTTLRGTCFSSTRPGIWAGDPSTVLRRRFVPGASAANLAAAPAAQDDSGAASSDDNRMVAS
jgi:hypothetical protein